MAPVLIGISGPSRAGKGVLVRNLLQYLVPKKAKEEKPQSSDHSDASRGVLRFLLDDGSRVSVINQDWYFLHEKVQSEMEGNYESPGAIDHDSVFRALEAERATPGMSYVMLEGFLAFHDDRVLPLLDWRLWIDVPPKVALQRRIKTKFVKIDYFNDMLWPAHERYAAVVFESQRQQRLGKVHRIDGTQPIKAVFRNVVTLLDLQPRDGGQDQRESGAVPQFRIPKAAQIPQALPRFSSPPICDNSGAWNGYEQSLPGESARQGARTQIEPAQAGYRPVWGDWQARARASPYSRPPGPHEWRW